MKRQIAVLMAIGVTCQFHSLVRAQPATKARTFSAREWKGLQWPKSKAHSNASFKAETAALQYLLRRQGFFQGKPDGVFGAQTARRVRDFQRAKGLKADGVVGPQTWPKLLIRLKRGDRGDAVRALQILLRSQIDHVGATPFLNLEVDGVLGSATEKILRSYQEGWINDGLREGKMRVKVDGVVGPQTWWALFDGGFEE